MAETDETKAKTADAKERTAHPENDDHRNDTANAPEHRKLHQENEKRLRLESEGKAGLQPGDAGYDNVPPWQSEERDNVVNGAATEKEKLRSNYRADHIARGGNPDEVVYPAHLREDDDKE